jgi:hypothetical protein
MNSYNCYVITPETHNIHACVYKYILLSLLLDFLCDATSLVFSSILVDYLFHFLWFSTYLNSVDYCPLLISQRVAE